MSLKELAREWAPVWRKSRPVKGPATHDYSSLRVPGHDYTFRPIGDGLQATAMGWGNGIERDDFLLLKNRSNPDGKAKYRVEEIEYFRDPSDMWSAKLSFVARQFCSECKREASEPHNCPSVLQGEPAT